MLCNPTTQHLSARCDLDQDVVMVINTVSCRFVHIGCELTDITGTFCGILYLC